MSLADTYNLRAEQASMSDVAAAIDALETITSYTPTYTYTGTSVTLTTLNFAEYVKSGGGKLIHLDVSTKVTLVGTGAFLSVSLPFAAKAGTYRSISCYIAVGGTLNFEITAGVINGTNMSLVRSGGANYTAGVWDLYIGGTYYAA